MKSNIVQLIEHWSNTFGLPVRDKATIPDKEEIELIYNLIEEEFREFREAINMQSKFYNTTTGTQFYQLEVVEQPEDIVEIADSLTDMLWLVIRAMQQFGLDVDKCVEAVYESNMSKLCKTYQEAEDTIEFYKQKGIIAYYEFWANRGYVIKNMETGKVLKSINFKEPKFEL